MNRIKPKILPLLLAVLLAVCCTMPALGDDTAPESSTTSTETPPQTQPAPLPSQTDTPPEQTPPPEQTESPAQTNQPPTSGTLQPELPSTTTRRMDNQITVSPRESKFDAEDIAKRLKKAAKNGRVTLSLDEENYHIPTAIFTELSKYPDKAIVLKAYQEEGTAKLDYSYTFLGSDVKATQTLLLEFSAKISSQSAYEKAIASRLANANLHYRTLSFAYKGSFPGAATVRFQLPVGMRLSGQQLYLYRYNPESKTFTYLEQYLSAASSGYSEALFTQGGEYIITDAMIPGIDGTAAPKPDVPAYTPTGAAASGSASAGVPLLSVTNPATGCL